MFKRDQNISRHIKRGWETKIPQSSSPLTKVGDEAVHKELGDRMERATATASSLEAEELIQVVVPGAKIPYWGMSMLKLAKDAQAKEIAALQKRIQRLERRKMSRPTGLKRLRKVGMSRRVKSFEDQESLDAPEDRDKNDDLMFDSGNFEDDVMHVEAKVDGKDEQSKKPDDSTAGEAVTTASIDDSAVPTTSEEITLAQTLIQIKAAKPKVVTTAATTATTTRPKDREDKAKEKKEEVRETIKVSRKKMLEVDTDEGGKFQEILCYDRRPARN
ncbi:hypothetical protein Tco_1285663 [Tanacetum coccineum]